MPRSESPWIRRLQEHLRNERYSRSILSSYPNAARCFIRETERRNQSLETVSPADVDEYLDALRLKRGRKKTTKQIRWLHSAAIKILLRLVNGQWPPQVLPSTPNGIAIRNIVEGYDGWMALRGLSTCTRASARAETERLLKWISDRAQSVAAISVTDIDAYIAWRGVSMRRASLALLASQLRAVFRYLHESGQIPSDLAVEISGPRLYALEGIPSMLRPEDVARALKAAKCDRSIMGRRDYAILTLLATYGLRAGEILRLRLSDIDWRHERLRIRHTKTGAQSELPLLPGPAAAILNYLKCGRPATTLREVFLRARAPYRAITSPCTLRRLVTRKLQDVDVVLTGKRGSHVFRHSRAVSLLRNGVPIKVIGDLLEHRSERSTGAYLKLATEDLRSVALDLPAGVSP